VEDSKETAAKIHYGGSCQGGGKVGACLPGGERVIVLNPGSTSTKVALFCGEKALHEETVRHPDSELGRFGRIAEQRQYRAACILELLERWGLPAGAGAADAVVGRGGVLRPVPGGTFLVNDRMVDDLLERPRWEHASNLGAPIARDLAALFVCPAFVVDPVAVDELDDMARLSGQCGMDRVSLAHALNTRVVARKVAAAMGREYAACNLVVAHLGGGVSVSAHRRGRMVDVNNANEEGPFGPERSGGLPLYGVIEACFDAAGRGQGRDAVKDLFTRRGGVFSYLGTRDVAAAEERALGGDARAALVLDAMCYQVAKEIGAMAAALAGDVDRVVITGGMARSRYLVERIAARVSFIAGVEVDPGEDELSAMAGGALRVLRGEEEPRQY